MILEEHVFLDGLKLKTYNKLNECYYMTFLILLS